MMFNAEKRARVAEVLSIHDDTAAVAGASASPAPLATQTTPVPLSTQATPATPSTQVTLALASSAPIVAIPLATVRASLPPAPLKKGKGVVLIASDDEEDTMEGPAFKRRKAAKAATSHSSLAGRPASFRDNPPSSSSPQGPLALEGGNESVPEPAPAPTPELPLVLQQILKGYRKGAMGSYTIEAVQKNLALSLGEFFAQANASSHEAELETKEQLALVEELALVKEQLANQAQGFFIHETALTPELSALRQDELEANNKLHDKGQEYTTLLGKVVPLRVQVVELQE